MVNFLKEGRRFLGEVYGTMVLTFIVGLGKVAVEITHGQVSHTAQAASKGLVLCALIYSTGQISGAHLNPAVTLAFSLRRVFTFWRLPFYWLAQFCGALLASSFIWAFTGESSYHAGPTPHFVSYAEAFWLESLFSFILIFTILNVTERGEIVGANAAIAIGTVDAAIQLIGGSFTGTPLNPANALGQAVFSKKSIMAYWIYFVAPFLGSIVAVAMTYAVARFTPNPEAVKIAKGEGRSTEVGGAHQVVDIQSEREPLMRPVQ